MTVITHSRENAEPSTPPPINNRAEVEQYLREALGLVEAGTYNPEKAHFVLGCAEFLLSLDAGIRVEPNTPSG